MNGFLRRAAKLFWPVPFAVLLFGLNNIAILAGWLYPPDGHSPALMIRAQDMAQYFTWLGAFQNQWPIADYHAPWQTEPALFNPLLLLLARACNLLGVQLVTGYHSVHLLIYVLAAYSLYFALRTFTQTSRQAKFALGVVICSVPLQTVAILPALVRRGSADQLPGVGDFVWWSSDGFFHGISGSLLVTFGTATTILTFTLIARYLDSNEKRYFRWSLLVLFVSAIVHPFEVLVIASASTLTLLISRGRAWRKSLREITAIALTSLLGLAPYMLLAFKHQWLMDVAQRNHWQPPSPWRTVVFLGLPTILVIVLLCLRPRLSRFADVLLVSWFACTLIGLYVPWLPWSQHLLDGYHYGTALLLVRLTTQPRMLELLNRFSTRALRGAFACWCLLSLGVYLASYYQSFKDGSSAEPKRLFSAVAPTEEAAVISWLRKEAHSKQLVLAPEANAPWLATVPMHSFASHHLFSLTNAEQSRLSNDFYSGHLSYDEARHLLNSYGVSFVVVPQESAAEKYLVTAMDRTSVGSFVIYRLAENEMKPYSGIANGDHVSAGRDKETSLNALNPSVKN